LTRYLDLLWVPISHSYYLFAWKILYIVTSIYILALMRVYPWSPERPKARRLGIYCLAGSLIGTPFVMLIFSRETWHYVLEVRRATNQPRCPPWSVANNEPTQHFRTFSLILESTCVLPQLLLLRQTTVPTVIDSYYLLALGGYRALYILNWIYRFATERFLDPPAVVFGIVQTALYADFAWIYYTRQRVKLRGDGGLLDAEDVQNGWLLRPLIGRKSVSLDEERPVLPDDGDGVDGRATASPAAGEPGILPAHADDAVPEHPHETPRHHLVGADTGPDELVCLTKHRDDDGDAPPSTGDTASTSESREIP
jgi:ER lumen protein retaining receptor